MDGLAIAASLREVQAAAEGGLVRSIYQPTKSTFVLHVLAGGNRRILLAPRHAAIHLTELKLPNPLTPSPFVMLLRRRLSGGRIVAIRQRGWDRVVEFEIERREKREVRRLRLVVELVGVRGNLFLLDGVKVLGSAHRDQRNRPGSAYASLTAQEKLDPRTLSVEDLARLPVSESAERALARAIDGIGRQTAQDLLSDLNENASAAARAEAIHASLRSCLAYIEEPSPWVVAEDGRATFYPISEPAEPRRTFGAALDTVSEALTETIAASEERSMHSDLSRALTRRKRTLQKLREWLDNAEEAERLQSLADLLMIHHTEIEPKSTRVVLTDPSTGQEETVRLLPSLSPIENAQRLYERAKRLRRGRPHVTSRIVRLERESRLLEKAIDDHGSGRPIEGTILALLPGAASKRPPPARSTTRSGIRIDGFSIRIGRSARDNDRLLRNAASDDLWLHAKGFAGSHVLIQRGGRREIPATVVEHAARLAAERSKGRGERRVEVVVTEVKYLRKPRGAAPGLVNVSRSDTLTVEL